MNGYEDFFPAELAAAYRRDDQQVMATQTTLAREEKYHGPDQTTQFVQTIKSPVRDAAGRVIGVQGIFWDITDRKRAEEKLKESETFLLVSQQVARVGSWQWDLRTNRVRWSQTMYEIYGIPPDQFDGTLEAAVRGTHPEDLPAVAALVQSIMAGESPTPIEYRVLKPNGEIVHLWGHGNATKSEEGQLVTVTGTVMDITQRKRAEEERRKLEAQVLHAQKLESLGVLAGGIAHDFNNLLTGILGFANLARMQLAPDAPVVPLLEEIERGGERAADLAGQMLAYSGRGKFVIRIVALDALVREMVKLLQTVVSKKAELRLDLAPALIEGDVTQIRQVIMNLITNASDALGGREGIITIRTSLRDCNREFLRSRFLPDSPPEGGYACLEVRDSGCGMSEETLQRIFDPFFTTKSMGRGLGLAAVLGIVRGHQGTLHVSSIPGQGTSFQVLIPCSSGTRNEPAIANNDPPRSGASGLVLVVDDEESVRSFARSVLENAGFRVCLACHGREGVTIFEQRQNEIVGVIVDMTMPQMDGREVAARLNALRPGIPILLMSGYNEQEMARYLSEIGVAKFIQKPFRPSDLLSHVYGMLPDPPASVVPGTTGNGGDGSSPRPC